MKPTKLEKPGMERAAGQTVQLIEQWFLYKENQPKLIGNPYFNLHLQATGQTSD